MKVSGIGGRADGGVILFPGMMSSVRDIYSLHFLGVTSLSCFARSNGEQMTQVPALLKLTFHWPKDNFHKPINKVTAETCLGNYTEAGDRRMRGAREGPRTWGPGGEKMPG